MVHGRRGGGGGEQGLPGADFGAGVGGAGELVGVGPGVEGDGLEDVGDRRVRRDQPQELPDGRQNLSVVEVREVVELEKI